jgi:hypothetical protein
MQLPRPGKQGHMSQISGEGHAMRKEEMWSAALSNKNVISGSFATKHVWSRDVCVCVCVCVCVSGNLRADH